MRIQPELGDVALVLVGSLNPRIFTPDWFARHGLFTDKEAEASEVEVVHAQITSFRMEWLNIRVEQERFQAQIAEAPYIRVYDLVLRTFRELLPHTPLTKLGINRQVHFDVGDLQIRDKIGEMLAPKEPWGEWASFLSAGADKEHGGMSSLTMQQRKVDDRPKGYISACIEPSAVIGSGRTGIFIRINDHYEVTQPESVIGCEEIVEILDKNFEASIKRAEWIIDQIMKLK